MDHGASDQLPEMPKLPKIAEIEAISSVSEAGACCQNPERSEGSCSDQCHQDQFSGEIRSFAFGSGFG
jgi:hypothetical protein